MKSHLVSSIKAQETNWAPVCRWSFPSMPGSSSPPGVSRIGVANVRWCYYNGLFKRYSWISYDILGQMFGLVCQMSDVCFYGNLDSRTNSIRQLLVGQISPKFDSLTHTNKNFQVRCPKAMSSQPRNDRKWRRNAIPVGWSVGYHPMCDDHPLQDSLGNQENGKWIIISLVSLATTATTVFLPQNMLIQYHPMSGKTGRPCVSARLLQCESPSLHTLSHGKSFEACTKNTAWTVDDFRNEEWMTW